MPLLKQPDRRPVQRGAGGQLLLRHSGATALAPEVRADARRDVFGRYLANSARHRRKLALSDSRL
jgi:hypothetical protein